MPRVDFIVKVDDGLGVVTTVGGQQNATLNRGTNMLDVTTKGSDWESYMAGLKNWSIDADGFIIEDDTAYTQLETAWFNNSEVQIEFSTATGSTFSGSALIESFPIESSNNDTAKYNITFKGNGALTNTV